MNDFYLRKETQKGVLGESIVDDLIASSGRYMPYAPAIKGSHPFDRLVAERNQNEVFIAEIKSKAHRQKYPDTGINVRHYEKYLAIAKRHNMKVFLFFCDELEKKNGHQGWIYGNYIDVLDQPREVYVEKIGRHINYPFECRSIGGIDIRYWPLVAMKYMAKITSQNVMKLKSLSSRNPIYD